MTCPSIKINFTGPNGGYLMINNDGKLCLSTTPDEHHKLIFVKERVKMENNQETVKFKSAHFDKYISGYQDGHIVTAEPAFGDDGEFLPHHSYWVMESYEETDGSSVALYHPKSQLYFVIMQNPESRAMELRLSTKDDVKDFGVFVLEPETD